MFNLTSIYDTCYRRCSTWHPSIAMHPSALRQLLCPYSIFSRCSPCLSRSWTHNQTSPATMDKCTYLRKYAFPDPSLLDFFLVLVGRLLPPLEIFDTFLIPCMCWRMMTINFDCTPPFSSPKQMVVHVDLLKWDYMHYHPHRTWKWLHATETSHHSPAYIWLDVLCIVTCNKIGTIKCIHISNHIQSNKKYSQWIEYLYRFTHSSLTAHMPIIIIIIIISVLPKTRSFTENSGTKAAILPKDRSSIANSGTKVAVLLEMNRCGIVPLLSVSHSLFSI